MDDRDVAPTAVVRGSTPAPHGETPVARWWRLGLASSIITLAVFGTVGVAWTRVVGLW